MAKPAPKSFHLRIPANLFSRIEAASQISGRSVNTEMMRALEAAFPSPMVDVSAVDMVMHYVASAPNAQELRERLEEVNERFINSGSALRIAAQPNGSLVIITEEH